MQTRRLIAAFLLGAGLCFVPALGQGEIRQDIVESKVSLMDLYLLEARVDHMMWNLTEFLGEDRLYIDFYYDRDGRVGRNLEFPESVDTMGKICITIRRSGDLSSYKSDFLLDIFSLKLTVIYASISLRGYFLTLDMDTDIVGLFYKGKEWTPLGYFYQGEYHLWGINRAKGTTKQEVTPSVPFLFKNVTVWKISRLRSGAVLGTRLTGEVVNQSGVTYNSHAWFKVTLYNRAGEVLGWREFTTFEFRDGERKRFKVFFNDVDSSAVWDWKIEFERGS